MYADSWNLRQTVPNRPQQTPAIALSVVLTVFGYSSYPVLSSVTKNAFPSLLVRVLIYICINYDNNEIKHRLDEERVLPHVGLHKYSHAHMLFAFTQSERPTKFLKTPIAFATTDCFSPNICAQNKYRSNILSVTESWCRSTADWRGGEQQKKTCRYIGVDIGNKGDRWQIEETNVWSWNREKKEEFLPPTAIYPTRPHVLASCSVTEKLGSQTKQQWQNGTTSHTHISS